jgi:Flp pilus assembly protein TadD
VTVPLDADPELLCVSATSLQGVYQGPPDAPNPLGWLAAREPVGNVGHSIYLFDLTHDRDAHRELADLYRRFRLPAEEARERARTLALTEGGTESTEGRATALRLAELNERLGRWDAALRLLDEMETAEATADDLARRAELARRLGKVERAADLWRRALRSRPGDPALMTGLAALYAEEGLEYAAAERRLARALEVSPEDAAALETRGWLRYRQGRARDAVADLESAAERAEGPALVRVRYRMARARIAAGERERGYRELELLLEEPRAAAYREEIEMVLKGAEMSREEGAR